MMRASLCIQAILIAATGMPAASRTRTTPAGNEAPRLAATTSDERVASPPRQRHPGATAARYNSNRGDRDNSGNQNGNRNHDTDMDHDDSKQPKVEREALEAAKEEPIETTLPPGCDLGCFIENQHWVKDKLEDSEEVTEEKVLHHFQKKNKQIYGCMCTCHGDPASGGGAIKDMVHAEEEGPESTGEHSIEVTLPPECDLKCFFDNHH